MKSRDDEEAPAHCAAGKTRLFVEEALSAGANIELRDFAGVPLHADGPDGGAGMIRQRLCPLPVFVDQQRNREVHTLIGSWVVGGHAAGIGIREDDTPITRNSSRFVPHIMLD